MKHILIILILTISTGLYGQDRPLMGKELGVLEAKIETMKENIVIYNQDGSVWMKFDFNFENELDSKNYTFEDVKKLYTWNDDFNPYAFHIDYFTLMFICTGVEGDKYKVIVNNESGLEKYIDKEKFWLLRNWQDHILHSVASIDFDKQENIVRSNPTEESAVIKMSEDIDVIVEPLEIKCDWLKIKYWEHEIEMTGWIRWKIGNQIIVSLFYFI